MIDMAERKRISEVLKMTDKEKTVISGFIRNIRNKGKNLKFIIVNDGSGETQVTCLRNIMNERIDDLNGISINSVLIFSGTVQKTELSNLGTEILCEDFDVLSVSEAGLPIDSSDKIESSLEKRLNWRFLDLRNEKKKIIFKIYSDFLKYSRTFFDSNNLTEIISSKIMGSASEGGSEVFTIDYFDRKAYLSQSPQFYKQMAISSGFEGVFEIGPAFRAEPSFTSRHTTEFTSLDIEIAYISSEEDIMKFEEKWLQYALKNIKEKYGEIIKELYNIEITVPEIPFPRINMKKAHEIAAEAGIILNENQDLNSDGEKALGEYVKKEFGNDFVFLTDFPAAVRPFYHMRPEDKSKTKSFDLIYKGVEITTGAQREHRYDILMKQIEEKGINPETLNEYTNYFRFGCPPHGGFGMSPARLVTMLLNLENIREATMVPRDVKRLEP